MFPLRLTDVRSIFCEAYPIEGEILAFYFSGCIYDWTIELLLKKIKEKVRGFVFHHDLFPLLDICSGTGTQCHLVSSPGKRVIGLDLNLSLLKYAASKYPHLSFVCAEASRIPIQNKSFKGIVISYALHDKPPELREKILAEARRLLVPEGKIILVDFEKPWSKASHLASFFISLIERIAGRKHFRNGRQFLKQGGLRELIRQNELIEIERYDIELGSSAAVVAKFS
jgi:demethylmenaquinone methyltransferase/2-methoxy-6-polyprenyl-1,4-benzoquinol methylase